MTQGAERSLKKVLELEECLSISYILPLYVDPPSDCSLLSEFTVEDIEACRQDCFSRLPLPEGAPDSAYSSLKEALKILLPDGEFQRQLRQKMEQQQQAQDTSSNQSLLYNDEAFDVAVQKEFERVVSEIERSTSDFPLQRCIKVFYSLYKRISPHVEMKLNPSHVAETIDCIFRVGTATNPHLAELIMDENIDISTNIFLGAKSDVYIHVGNGLINFTNLIGDIESLTTSNNDDDGEKKALAVYRVALLSKKCMDDHVLEYVLSFFSADNSLTFYVMTRYKDTYAFIELGTFQFPPVYDQFGDALLSQADLLYKLAYIYSTYCKPSTSPLPLSVLTSLPYHEFVNLFFPAGSATFSSNEGGVRGSENETIGGGRSSIFFVYRGHSRRG